MYECMPRGSSFDLAQAYEISALKVPVSMLELPQGRIWRSSVENVAHCSSLAEFLQNVRANDAPL